MPFKFLSAILVSFIFQGCGDTQNRATSEPKLTAELTQIDVCRLADDDQNLEATLIKDSYQRNTKCESRDGVTSSIKELHINKSSHLILKESYFNGADCSLKLMEIERSFDLNTIKNSTSDVGDSFIGCAVLMEVRVTPKFSTVVTDFNQKALYGVTDWELEVAQVVTGKVSSDLKHDEAGAEVPLTIVKTDQELTIETDSDSVSALVIKDFSKL